MTEFPMTKTMTAGTSAIRSFEFPISNLFRNSYFVLRVSACILLLALPYNSASAAELKFTTADESRAEFERSVRPFLAKHCVGCHGAEGLGGLAPALQSKQAAEVNVWKKERILPLRSPYATVVWDFIRRGMPLGLEGTLMPDEVYSLTAYLLFLNHVIAEDQVLDKQNLPTIKMPIGDEFGKPHEFKLNAPRLKGYPY